MYVGATYIGMYKFIIQGRNGTTFGNPHGGVGSLTASQIVRHYLEDIDTALHQLVQAVSFQTGLLFAASAVGVLCGGLEIHHQISHENRVGAHLAAINLTIIPYDILVGERFNHGTHRTFENQAVQFVNIDVIGSEISAVHQTFTFGNVEFKK